MVWENSIINCKRIVTDAVLRALPRPVPLVRPFTTLYAAGKYYLGSAPRLLRGIGCKQSADIPDNRHPTHQRIRADIQIKLPRRVVNAKDEAGRGKETLLYWRGAPIINMIGELFGSRQKG